MKQVLISFVGSNDEGKLMGKPDGAVLTLLSKMKFDEIYLLWNPTKEGKNFFAIADYLKKEILIRKRSKKVNLYAFELDNVTDHNEIYPKLLDFCKSIEKNNTEYTAAIALHMKKRYRENILSAIFI
jgi:hypothetical protein